MISKKVSVSEKGDLPTYHDPDWRKLIICLELPYSDLGPGYWKDGRPSGLFGTTIFDRNWLELILESFCPDRDVPLWLFLWPFETDARLAIVRNSVEDFENAYFDPDVGALSDHFGSIICDASCTWSIVTGYEEYFYLAGEDALVRSFERSAGGSDVVELFMALSIAKDPGWLISEQLYGATDWEMPAGLSTEERSGKDYGPGSPPMIGTPAFRNMQTLIRKFCREADFDLKKWFRLP